jgi:hypothetical protein
MVAWTIVKKSWRNWPMQCLPMSMRWQIVKLFGVHIDVGVLIFSNTWSVISLSLSGTNRDSDCCVRGILWASSHSIT